MPKKQSSAHCTRILVHVGRGCPCSMSVSIKRVNTGFKEKYEVTSTVVVYVQPSTSFDWSALRTQLLTLTSGDPEIDIAFHPGVVRGIMNSGSPATKLELAKPGSCYIGVKGSCLSGTLGGYFDLEFEGKIREGFLTSYHGLAPSNADEDVQKKSHAPGSSSSDLDDESCCEVVSPSEGKIAKDISIYNHLVGEFVTKKMRLIEIKYMLEDCGESTDWVESFDADIKTIRNDLEFCDAKLRQLDAMPLRIGKVLLSSGKATFDGRISHWAFVELDSDRPSFPNTMRLYQHGRPLDPPFYWLLNAAKLGAPATGFAEIHPGRMYLKQGTYSGDTLESATGLNCIFRRTFGMCMELKILWQANLLDPGNSSLFLPVVSLFLFANQETQDLSLRCIRQNLWLTLWTLEDKLSMDLGLATHFGASCRL